MANSSSRVLKTNGLSRPVVPRHNGMKAHVLPLSVCLLGATLVMIGYSQSFPMEPTNGNLVSTTPDGQQLEGPIIPGGRVEVSWHQNWHRLCPLTIHRVITGSDNVSKRPGTFDIAPPETIGVQVASGNFIFPLVPPGRAVYKAEIEPHCLIDKIWQRSYTTPDVVVMVGEINKTQQPPTADHDFTKKR